MNDPESKSVPYTGTNRPNSPSRPQIHRATPSTDHFASTLMAARYPPDQMVRMAIGPYPSLGHAPGVPVSMPHHLPHHLYPHVSQPSFIYGPRDGQFASRWSPRDTPEYPVQSSLDTRPQDHYSAAAAALAFRGFGQPGREMTVADTLHTSGGGSHHQTSSSQGPAARRRPSLLPPSTPDFAYPASAIYPGARIDSQDRIFESFPYAFNRKITQQQVVTAQMLREMDPSSAMTHHLGGQAHPLITPSHHGLTIGSSSTPHHLLAHGHVIEQPSDQDVAPKRPRLYIEPKPSLHQPLHIDTGNSGGTEVNKKPAYTPQVEAISPTLPNEDTRNDLSPFRSTRDELTRNIDRLDREISEVETQILKLKKKQHELEAASKTTPEVLEVMDTSSESKQQSIAQLVYSDNRKKAQAAHSLLDRLNHLENSTTYEQLTSCLPLYNQPSDTAIYHLNRDKFKTFKPKLMVYLKKQKERERSREQYLTQTYEKLTLEWKEKQENKDGNSSKKSKESKMREFFEKQFPELKKQREDKERLSRAGQRIRSDADMEDVLDGLQEQEAEDKKMRSYAVIPPILQDKRNRKPIFINRNNLVEDALSEHKERQHINVWTEQEKEIFKEKYLLQPKNFGLISSYLEKKSVCDCVQYYYLSKKVENYKQLLRRHVKKRTRALVKQQQAAAAAAAAAQQQQQQQNNRVISRQIVTVTSSTTATTTTTTTTADDSASTTTASVTVASAINSSAVTSESSSATTSLTTTTNVTTTATTSSVAATRSDEAKPTIDCPEKGNNLIGSNIEPRVPKECFVCKGQLQVYSKSKPITKNNCHHYGILPENLTAEARACLDCRFKYIRRKCPLPSCKTQERKVKRLKSLPQKWFDLNPDLRRIYSQEMNVPLDTKKCCTRCFMRISRRIGALSSERLVAYHENWSEEDITTLRKLLQEYGRDWTLISSSLKKPLKECMKFCYTNKYKLNLYSHSHESGKVAHDSDSDEFWNSLTDDSEETSSADEGNGQSTSDTASASSPPVLNSDENRTAVNTASVATTTSVGLADIQSGKLQDLRGLSSSQASLKSDNDSSATMSADEGHADVDRERGSSSPSSLARGVPTSNQDSIYSPLNNSYLSRPAEGLIAQRTQRVQVPSFLINPNAPSTTNRAPVHPVTSVPMVTKEEPTCVRDLIYQAIEMSLQNPNKPSKGPGPISVSGAQGSPAHPYPSIPSSIPPGLAFTEGRRTPLHTLPLPHPLELKPELLTSSAFEATPNKGRISTPPVAQELRHPGVYTPPSTVSRPVEGLMMSYPHHLTTQRQQTHSTSPDNEVQDLSKKSRESPRSQTPLHLRKDRPSTPNRSHPYSKPPPAHSNIEGVVQRDLYIDGPKLKSTFSIPPSDRIQIAPPPPRTPSQSRPLVPPPPLITSRPGVSSPKLHQMKESRSPHGSITQGTPVMIPGTQSPMLPYGPPYDAILRPPSVPKEPPSGGSITLGTPVHHDPSKRKLDNHKNPYETSYEQLYRMQQRAPGMASPFRAIYPNDPHTKFIQANVSEAYIPSMSKMEKPPHPPASPSVHKEQLLIDFNTSKQMNARRGSSGEGKDPSQSLARSRDSSSPQVPSRIQTNMYTPLTGSSIVSHASSLPIYTHGMSDRVYMGDRSTPTSLPDRSQMSRQNVIQAWPQKPMSVIQTAKTASPRNDPQIAPNDLVRKVQPGYPYENLRTLVDVATAQAGLPITEKPPDQQKEQHLPHVSVSISQGIIKSESPKDHRLDDRQRVPSAMRFDARPDLWLDPAARDRIRPMYMSVPISEASRVPADLQRIHIPDSIAASIASQGRLPIIAGGLIKDQQERERASSELQKRMDPKVNMDERYRQVSSKAPKSDSIDARITNLANPYARGPPGSQMTAANLIDDIIQRQINQPQSNEARAASAAARFQDLRMPVDSPYDHPQVERMTEDFLQMNQRLMQPHHSSPHLASSSKVPVNAPDLPPSSAAYSAVTLGDRISSLVSRNYNTSNISNNNNSDRGPHSSPKQSQEERIFQPHALSPHVRTESRSPSTSLARQMNEESPMDASANIASNWKLRRALQQDQEDRQSSAIRTTPTMADAPRDLSRPGSRSGSGSATPSASHPASASPMNPLVEPISPPSEDHDESRKQATPRPHSHSSPIVRSLERPPSSGTKSPSASRQSLDRTPPALEISEDAASNESPVELK